jgi:methionine-rich copper-binding protein CopC
MSSLQNVNCTILVLLSPIESPAAFVTLLAILSLLFQVNSVMAHAALVKSDPPRRASLSLPPNSTLVQ